MLLIEDEPSLNGLLIMVLEEYGVRVTSVTTAEQGLAALFSEQWTLLITDVRTPGKISGIELALIALERLPSTSVIVMSSHYEQLITHLSPDINFLPKPWSMDIFTELLSSLLQIPIED